MVRIIDCQCGKANGVSTLLGDRNGELGQRNDANVAGRIEHASQ